MEDKKDADLALAKAVERQERLRNMAVNREEDRSVASNGNSIKKRTTQRPSQPNAALVALQRRIDQKNATNTVKQGLVAQAARNSRVKQMEQPIASTNQEHISSQDSKRGMENYASEKDLVGAMNKEDSNKGFEQNIVPAKSYEITDTTNHGLEAELIDDLEDHRERMLEKAKADIISNAVVAQAQEDFPKQTSQPKKYQGMLIVLAGIVVLGAIVGGLCASGKCTSSSTRAFSKQEITETINAATLSNTTVQYPVIGRETLTPEEEALQYLVENVPEGLSHPSGSWRLEQRYALCVFMYANGYLDENEERKETAWFARTSNDECAWSGVSCTNGRVVEINMKDMYLVGTLPSDFGLLTDLTVINLAGNKLDGGLPAVLKKLSSLQILDIEDNEFRGSLFPSFMETLQLRQFNAKDNWFSGTIPPALGSQTQLDTLDISYNSRLKGPVPTSLASLSELTSLSFGDGIGGLTGTMPAFVQQMTNLRSLTVRETTFDSPENQLLPLYTELTKLTHLSMASMMTFEQTIPSILGEAWPDMEHFDVIRNKIIGTLPSSLAKWTALKTFSVLGNSINGTIPEDYFESWSDLEVFRLGENRIAGTLPTLVGSWSNLNEFDIGHNQFSGTLPTEVGLMTDVQHFHVHQNRFTGTIPLEVLNFQPIDQWYEANNFTGTAPFCQNGVSFNPAHVDCDEVDCPCCEDCIEEL